jgi:hypothetical protein
MSFKSAVLRLHGSDVVSAADEFALALTSRVAEHTICPVHFGSRLISSLLTVVEVDKHSYEGDQNSVVRLRDKINRSADPDYLRNDPVAPPEEVNNAMDVAVHFTVDFTRGNNVKERVDGSLHDALKQIVLDSLHHFSRD